MIASTRGAGRTGDPLGLVTLRIDADFAHPDLGQIGISFTSYRKWVGEGGAAVLSVGKDKDSPVCLAAGRSFPISLDLGVEQAIVTVASALQDDVMDHLNRPWPQVGPEKLVLEPRLDEAGLAVWASKDGALRCPVGYLGSSLGALGQVT